MIIFSYYIFSENFFFLQRFSILRSYTKLFWLVSTKHAQITTFPFEKESPCVENLFITIYWLTFSYMSLFVFVNISFVWSNFTEETKMTV